MIPEGCRLSKRIWLYYGYRKTTLLKRVVQKGADLSNLGNESESLKPKGATYNDYSLVGKIVSRRDRG